MQSTRQTVLEALNSAGRATVNQIADTVGVKAVTVRHHLNGLRADGLIQAEAQRQPVGRPVMVYSLTPKAYERFPKKYHSLIERLFDQLKELSPEMLDDLINALADSMVDELRQTFESLSPEQRRAHLIEVLNNEGFIARWHQTDDGLQLVEYHCPYYVIGLRHPEVCQIDEALIRAAIDAEIKKEACLLDGDPTCTFTVISRSE